ncbi:hypothetical protein BGZ72_010966 [Mortierella alpina]|nr:hypothetical protein BGZ72_010966 [Mortierella alpina]
MTSRLQPQQESVLDRVPVEIIEAFGRCLDGPSLFASLQVCQRWHQALRPLIWTSITKLQFDHPQFPLNSQCTSEDIVALQRDLVQVRHIEWSCKMFINHRRWGPSMPFIPLEHLSADKMALIFTYTSNLQTLTLDLWEMDTHFSCLEVLNQRTLRRLEIEASRTDCVELDKILPLLSRLEELKLAGSKSSWTTSIPRDKLPLPGTIWKLTKLHIHCWDMVLLQYCPELRELELYWPSQMHLDGPLALRDISTCTKLEALMFTPIDQFPWLPVQDLPELLTSLRGLKRLFFSAHSVEEVEFLCALNGHATLSGNVTAQITENGLGSWRGNENKVLVLPLLEHLSIAIDGVPMNGNNTARLHHAFSLMLKSRPALKTVIVRSFEFDPRELLMEEWACKDLETLSLEFSWTLGELPDEERQGLWRHVYRQIGSLSKLKSLMLWCAGLDKGVDSGMEALAGTSGLERLALSDERL